MSLSHFIGEYGNLIMMAGSGVGGWCANMMNGYLRRNARNLMPDNRRWPFWIVRLNVTNRWMRFLPP